MISLLGMFSFNECKKSQQNFLLAQKSIVYFYLSDNFIYLSICNYPGIADSIRSDLRLVKPVALRMFGLSEREMAKYFEEVESKLLEETDYGMPR
jgi:hypothetical protein